tara:strand:+ start:2163 stop:2750 length:588 start_codon:yes stop_codon:yes gene_type:complete
MEKAFEQFYPTFLNHHTTPNVEVEFRLGKKNNRYFDTNVGDDVFFRLKRALEKFEGWEKTDTEEYQVYTNDSECRAIIHEDESQEYQIKKRLDKLDYSSGEHPFDVRMAISTETPTENQEDVQFNDVRSCARTSYFRKGLRIDLTIVSGDPDDPDDEEDTKYQVEFEIIEPKGVDTKSKFYNHLHKVKDLMKCVK